MKPFAHVFMSLISKFRTTCLATLEFKAPMTVNKVVLKNSSRPIEELRQQRAIL